MIDIGLTKIALIGVVALVVIGPEKLPRVARMAGTLFGRAQRYLNQIKSEVSREIELEELRKMQQDIQQAAGDVQQSIVQNLSETQDALHASWHDSDAIAPYPIHAVEPERFALKVKNFRRKKLGRTSAIPSWYKHQHGRKTRVTSAAARVAKYRPAAASRKSGFFH